MNFDLSYQPGNTLKCKSKENSSNKKYIIYCTVTSNVRFNGTTSKYGLLVTTINGKEANSAATEYWQILGGKDMEPLQLGVSSYVPANSEKVLFRFATWVEEDHGDHGGARGLHGNPGLNFDLKSF